MEHVLTQWNHVQTSLKLIISKTILKNNNAQKCNQQEQEIKFS